MDIYSKFENCLKQIQNSIYPNCETAKIGLAISGGSDSMGLLTLFLKYATKHNRYIKVYTINHGLRNESIDEVNYVQNFAQQNGIDVEVISWNAPLLKPGQVQKLAREFRYKTLTESCSKDKISLLATGHTLNDQMETYLIRESKHSTNFGLSCMSSIRPLHNGIKLIRPLLGLEREEIRNYLITLGIKWYDDPSNLQPKYNRVKFRNMLADNDELQMTVRENIRKYGHIRHQLEKEINELIEDNVRFEHYCAFVSKEIFDKSDNALHAIRRIIWQIGGAVYPCQENSLSNMLHAGKKFTIGRCVLAFHNEGITIYRENKNFSSVKFFEQTEWDNRFYIMSKNNDDHIVSNFKKSAIEELMENHPGAQKQFPKLCLPEHLLIQFPAIYSTQLKLISVPDIGYNNSNYVVKSAISTNFEQNFVMYNQ